MDQFIEEMSVGDLEIAKETLRRGDYSLVIVRDGRMIYASRSHGIGGILQAIEELDNRINGASVADRIIGKAAALLLAYSKVKDAYAIVISRNGLETLRSHGIPVDYESLVPKILDRSGREICPFEKIALKIDSPRLGFEVLRRRWRSLIEESGDHF